MIRLCPFYESIEELNRSSVLVCTKKYNIEVNSKKDEISGKIYEQKPDLNLYNVK